MKKILYVLALMLISPPDTYAYIPSTANILKKTVKNHGESAYLIEQEVQFQLGPQTILVHERWLVEDGDTMRLEVRPVAAKSWSMDMVYSGQKRFAWDGDKVKSYSLSPEFVENLFHYRSLGSILGRLVRMDILPQRALKVANSSGHSATGQYSPEPWVRLGRVAGTVSFVLSSSDKPSALWVEQDSFLIHKVRFDSQAELVVDEHREQTQQLTFPQLRRYLWNQHSVLVRTTNVAPITIGPKSKAALSPQSLTQTKNQTLPEHPIIQEFYSRFR